MKIATVLVAALKLAEQGGVTSVSLLTHTALQRHHCATRLARFAARGYLTVREPHQQHAPAIYGITDKGRAKLTALVALHNPTPHEFSALLDAYGYRPARLGHPFLKDDQPN